MYRFHFQYHSWFISLLELIELFSGGLGEPRRCHFLDILGFSLVESATSGRCGRVLTL